MPLPNTRGVGGGVGLVGMAISAGPLFDVANIRRPLAEPRWSIIACCPTYLPTYPIVTNATHVHLILIASIIATPSCHMHDCKVQPFEVAFVTVYVHTVCPRLSGAS